MAYERSTRGTVRADKERKVSQGPDSNTDKGFSNDRTAYGGNERTKTLERDGAPKNASLGRGTTNARNQGVSDSERELNFAAGDMGKEGATAKAKTEERDTYGIMDAISSPAANIGGALGTIFGGPIGGLAGKGLGAALDAAMHGNWGVGGPATGLYQGDRGEAGGTQNIPSRPAKGSGAATPVAGPATIPGVTPPPATPAGTTIANQQGYIDQLIKEFKFITMPRYRTAASGAAHDDVLNRAMRRGGQ